MATHQARLDDSRQALLPAAALSADPASNCETLIHGGAAFLEYLLAQDLGALWHYHLQTNNHLKSLPPDLVEALSRIRRAAAAGYLAQRAALMSIDELFEDEGIAYVAIKGATVRELVYADPSIRSSCDIDILIAPADRQRAVKILVDAGYSLHVSLDNASHQATFSTQTVDIDLHWDILRPGRTRDSMTERLLERRQRLGNFWGVSDNDIMFLMLTHPAFNKYVCSPNMGLARVADFLLWIQQKTVDWPVVLNTLEQAGLKTAAWTMLNWFRMLAQPDAQRIMDRWINTLRPGGLRASYLRYWLAHDMPTRWLKHPLLIQVGFTLFLHDRLADALHAINGWLNAKRNSRKDINLLTGDGCPVWRHAK